MDKLNVIQIPEICGYNPFIGLLSSSLEKNGVNVLKRNICIDSPVLTDPYFDPDSLKEYLEKKIVFHFHWPEKLYRKIGIDGYKKMLEFIKMKGWKIVYTVHNLEPHENKKNSDSVADIIRYSDCLICFSEGQKRALLKRYADLNDAKINVVGHGPYPQLPTMLSLNINSLPSRKSYKLIFIAPGRIRAYKQIPLLLKAFTALANSKTALIIAGNPDDMNSVKLIKKAAEKHINIHGIFEFLSEDKLNELISFSDIVILHYSRIWSSGMFIKAIGLKKPIISPIPEMFDNIPNRHLGENLFYKKGDEEDIKRSLSSAWKKRNELDLIANLNYNTFKTPTWEKVGSVHKKIYLSLYD